MHATAITIGGRQRNYSAVTRLTRRFLNGAASGDAFHHHARHALEAIRLLAWSASQCIVPQAAVTRRVMIHRHAWRAGGSSHTAAAALNRRTEKRRCCNRYPRPGTAPSSTTGRRSSYRHLLGRPRVCRSLTQSVRESDCRFGAWHEATHSCPQHAQPKQWKNHRARARAKSARRPIGVYCKLAPKGVSLVCTCFSRRVGSV